MSGGTEAPLIKPLSGLGISALLVGVGDYAYELPSVPAVRRNLEDMTSALIERCGAQEKQIRSKRDPDSVEAVLLDIVEAAQAAQDLLIFYYVGHGLVSVSGELFLATSRTRDGSDLLLATGIPYATVRSLLLNSPAQTKVVILDCCFSGRAQALSGPSASGLAAALSEVDGGYVISASARSQLALAPEGEPYTAFTGAILRLLQEGDDRDGPNFTLKDIYDRVRQSLHAQGRPLPELKTSANAAGLLFSVNVGHVPQPDLPTVRRRETESGRAGAEIYNSEDPERAQTFRHDWAYFHSIRAFDEHFFSPMPGVVRIRSGGEGDVGMNKAVDALHVAVRLEYLVESADPARDHIYFCAIPMKTRDHPGGPLVEAGSDGYDDPRNATSPLRTRFPIPAGHWNDGRWHTLTCEYDLRDVPEVSYSIFATRINEGVPSKGSGSLVIRHVQIWDLSVGPG